MSTIEVEQFQDTINWDDLDPNCETRHHQIPCPHPAAWTGHNLACSCDPAPYLICEACRVLIPLKFMKCRDCDASAEWRWERL